MLLSGMLRLPEKTTILIFPLGEKKKFSLLSTFFFSFLLFRAVPMAYMEEIPRLGVEWKL